MCRISAPDWNRRYCGRLVGNEHSRVINLLTVLAIVEFEEATFVYAA